jgi:hypothetical protein
MPTELTEEIVEKINEEIRKIDRWIEEARNLVNQNQYDKAKEAVVEAIKHKRIILALIPSIWVLWNDNDAELPFEPVYDTLADMDKWAEMLDMLVADDGGNVSWHIPEPDLDYLIAKLRVALQELETNLIDHPWDEDDGAVDLLDKLKEALEKLIEAADKYEEDGTMPPGSVYQAVVSAKQRLLEEFSVDINLWYAYSQLKSIDAYLDKSEINLEDRLDWITDGDIIEWLEMAESIKHKFGILIIYSWNQKQESVDIPDPEPQRPDPPVPEYEPGQEELPPFPPEGPPWYAQRSFKHSHLLGLIKVNVTIVNDHGACTHVKSSLKLPLLPPLSIKRSKKIMISGKNLRWTLGETNCKDKII